MNNTCPCFAAVARTRVCMSVIRRLYQCTVCLLVYVFYWLFNVFSSHPKASACKLCRGACLISNKSTHDWPAVVPGFVITKQSETSPCRHRAVRHQPGSSHMVMGWCHWTDANYIIIGRSCGLDNFVGTSLAGKVHRINGPTVTALEESL